MKTLHIRYCDLPNMGDLLNKYMLPDLFGIAVEKAGVENIDMIAIGSALKSILIPNFRKNIKDVYRGSWFRKVLRKRPLYVWGTGFMRYDYGSDKRFYYRNVRILSLRGQLTKQRVEKILGGKLDVPLADGGLLAEKWIGRVNKKYRVGIIPHYKEQDSPIVESMHQHYENSIIINLRNDPDEVVRQIASCDYILSSSLHGLIVADSYHIPNCHVMFYEYGERMAGDGFKFADYYSSYGLTDLPVRLFAGVEFPSLEQISDNYRVRPDVVEEKKEAIFKLFYAAL